MQPSRWARVTLVTATLTGAALYGASRILAWHVAHVPDLLRFYPDAPAAVFAHAMADYQHAAALATGTRTAAFIVPCAMLAASVLMRWAVTGRVREARPS